MKKKFTLFVKGIWVIIFTLTFTNSFSTNNNASLSPVTNLKANIENNNLVIKWNVTPEAAINYCEVQASEDGKTFTTIGYVMGADPKQNNNLFTFKQNLSKLKSGKVFYRILNITADEKAIASEVVKLS